jgi:5-oxoprolinase (ATP-hydrolysing)
MCRPIQSLTEGKGYDARRHRLAAFGGAGGQHACSVAPILHIDEVVIHKYLSILSAYGMALADVVYECLEPSSDVLEAATPPLLQVRMDALQQKARDHLHQQGFADRNIRYERYLNLRYSGTSTALMIAEPADGDFALPSCFR